MSLKSCLALCFLCWFSSFLFFSCGKTPEETSIGKSKSFVNGRVTKTSFKEPLENAFVGIADRNGLSVRYLDIKIKGEKFRFIAPVSDAPVLTGKRFEMAQVEGNGDVAVEFICLNKNCYQSEVDITYAHRHAHLVTQMEVSGVEYQRNENETRREYSLFNENSLSTPTAPESTLGALNGAILVLSKIKGFTGARKEQLSFELLENGQQVIRLARHGGLRRLLPGLSVAKNLSLVSGPDGFSPDNIEYESPALGGLRDISRVLFRFQSTLNSHADVVLNIKKPDSSPSPSPSAQVAEILRNSVSNPQSLPAATPSAITAKEGGEAAP